MFKATRQDWEHWFSWLDRRRAATLTHPEITRLLERESVPAWWSQTIAVRYEQERGLRVPGQTSDGDFQVSTQKALAADPDSVWDVLLATGIVDGVPSWQEGAVHQLGSGTVTVRRVVAPQRLRFWYEPDGGPRTTVEIALTPARDKTTLRFTHGGLPDNEAREAFRARWRRLTARIQKGLDASV